VSLGPRLGIFCVVTISTSKLFAASPGDTTGPLFEPAMTLASVFKSSPSCVRCPPWQLMQRLSKIGRISFAKLTVAPPAAGCVAGISVAAAVSVGAAVSVAGETSVGASVPKGDDIAGTDVSVGGEAGVVAG
jgi:hypothetical protein